MKIKMIRFVTDVSLRGDSKTAVTSEAFDMTLEAGLVTIIDRQNGITRVVPLANVRFFEPMAEEVPVAKSAKTPTKGV